jgi:hypothetical protein
MMRSEITALLFAVTAAAAACDVHDPSAAGNLVPKTVDEDSSIPSLALAGSVFHYETTAIRRSRRSSFCTADRAATFATCSG